MKSVAERTRRAKYRRRVEKNGKIEQPWMNDMIRDEIKKRRKLNKEHRNWRGVEGREEAWRRYVGQKERVTHLIAGEMRRLEERLAEEIKGGNRGKDLWERINKLREKENKREDLKIYDLEGRRLEGEEVREEVRNFWQGIYKMHPNRMEEVWTEEARVIYEEDLELRRRQEREELRHEGPILPRIVLNPYRHMKVLDVEINKEEIGRIIGKLKNRKSGGGDGMKPEMYKILGKSEVFLERVEGSFRRVLETGEIPESWKRSRTVMIRKKRKPTVADLKPIAMTDISYKILMAVLRDQIEEQIGRNGMKRDEQVGFTAGGMIADNLFILQECVHETYRRREELVLVAIDFRKAYDSIKREAVLEVLKEYRIDGRVIDLFKKVYCNDSTIVEFGGGEDLEMEVQSGIRQGCAASTVLFKLITFKMIEALRRKISGVQVGEVRVRSLFYADDGLLVCGSVVEAEEGIEELRRVARGYGLEVNTGKSQCLLYNVGDEVGEVGMMDVVEEFRYLGVKVMNRRNMFEGHRKDMVNRAKLMSNLTYSVIERSCHKVLVGKSYWKGVVLPRVLYGAEVVGLRVKEMDSIQRQGNAAMRRMLGASRGVAVAGMRGDVGISTVKSRVARGRLQYMRRVEQGDNEMLRRVMGVAKRRDSEWVKETRKCMNWAGIEEEELKTMTKDAVKRRVADRVHYEWMEEMEGKSSLRVYRRFKREMREEDYEGGMESRVYFGARTRSLKLGCRRWGEGSVECRLCGAEREDDEHFLLECGVLEEIRNEAIELQRLRKEDVDEVVGGFLFGDVEVRESRRVLYRMWRRKEREEDVVVGGVVE